MVRALDNAVLNISGRAFLDLLLAYFRITGGPLGKHVQIVRVITRVGIGFYPAITPFKTAVKALVRRATLADDCFEQSGVDLRTRLASILFQKIERFISGKTANLVEAQIIALG